MIKVSIKNTNSVVKNINISGHAEYDEYGKDIICASVSTMLITTVNAILEFDENSIVYKEKEIFSLENIKKDEITNKLLKNLVSLLKELELKYPKNVEVKEE